MIRVIDVQLEVDDETLINGIGSLPGNLVKDSVSLESKDVFLTAPVILTLQNYTVCTRSFYVVYFFI